MNANNRRRTASVTFIILCSMLILLGTFVTRPVMAQFVVKDNSNNTLLSVSEEGNISAYGAFYPGAAAIQSDNFLGFDPGTKQLTLGSTQLTGTLNMGNQLISNVYAIEQAAGGWRLWEDGNADFTGWVKTTGLSLSRDNTYRGALWFSTVGDFNLALYNNKDNIDGEGGWDGTKWNVLSGLNIRVGSGPPYPSAMYIEGEGDFKGSVGIGTTSPQGALDVSSTKGAFIVPRMSTEQRGAFTPINGMIIYNTDTNQFNFRENDQWVTKANNP